MSSRATHSSRGNRSSFTSLASDQPVVSLPLLAFHRYPRRSRIARRNASGGTVVCLSVATGDFDDSRQPYTASLFLLQDIACTSLRLSALSGSVAFCRASNITRYSGETTTGTEESRRRAVSTAEAFETRGRCAGARPAHAPAHRPTSIRTGLRSPVFRPSSRSSVIPLGCHARQFATHTTAFRGWAP